MNKKTLISILKTNFIYHWCIHIPFTECYLVKITSALTCLLLVRKKKTIIEQGRIFDEPCKEHFGDIKIIWSWEFPDR